MDELSGLDATAQAELVRRRVVTPLDLVDAAITRIERLNPTFNAVITPMFDEARDAARRASVDGPLAGVPFLLKDLLAACAGVRMASGSAFLRDFVPQADSELVLRHKRAGLIILGKTNTPELGLLPTTEPRLFGPTRNPWDPGRTVGGSSGGAAAAVAARLVPIAHASDGGGSIRIPAACCGVFGLKPTRARNPLGPVVGDMMSGLVVEHAITRTVRDSAALLDATAGPEVGHPLWGQLPGRTFSQEVGADPGRLRIAFSTRAINDALVHADCVAAVHEAARLCADLGHEVAEAAPALDAGLVSQAFLVLWTAGCACTIDGAAWLTGRTATPDQFEPLTWALREIGHQHSAPTYLLALQALKRVAADVARFFQDYDLWLTPALAEPPLALGAFDAPPDNPLAPLARAMAFVPFTPLANITGQPAMSVPLSWSADGLPLGNQFMGRYGDEATLFRLAGQLEAARPWAGRSPPDC